MEYLPRGDILTLLMREDILSEDVARFYMAKSIMAIHSIHQHNYISLCKPLESKFSSILLNDEDYANEEHINDSDGEQVSWLIPKEKLKQWKRNRRALRDWWSLGAIMYEMLIRYPPFSSDDPRMTCRKIINWRTCLKFPEEPKVTKEARDLICHLLCDVESRLGTGGVDEIKAHPWFNGVKWDMLYEMEAAYKPIVTGELDTQNFEKFPKVEDPQSAVPRVGPWRKMLTSKDSNFIGYTKKLDMLKSVGASGMLLKQFCFSDTGHLSKTNYAPSFYKV
ncbi:serine/threonine-protein kinase tricorner [Tanacetum coccineum]